MCIIDRMFTMWFVLFQLKVNQDTIIDILNNIQILFKNIEIVSFFSDWQAMDILNDDFGDSEDNLSIQTLSEREFSPVSFAVSPVGSVHETDNEIVSDDVLLRGSPCLSDPSRLL